MTKRKKPKKASPVDWHRADIIAELRKAGWSLRKLATHHEYSSPTTLVVALDRPWPKGEKLIAEAIGQKPETIWPTRYAKRTAKDTTLHGANNQRSETGASKAA